MPRISAAALWKRLAQGQIDPCYLFFGEETYLIQEYTATSLEHILRTASRDFNCDVLSVDNDTLEDALSIARTLPMLATHRVVVLHGLHQLRKGDWPQLEHYLKHPSTSTVLICSGSVSDPKKYPPSLWQHAVTVECSRLAGSKLHDWASHTVAQRGYRIAPEALQALLHEQHGVAIAWAGDGLRHDLPEADLPTSGLYSVASFAAVTFYAVAPLDDSRRPARVVVGRSFATTALPFGPRDGGGELEVDGTPSWSVVGSGRPRGVLRTQDAWDLAPERGPVLRARAVALEERARGEDSRKAPTWWWVVLAVGVALAATACWRAVEAPSDRRLGSDPLPPLAAASLVVIYGAGASPPALVVAALGMAVAIAAARAPGAVLAPTIRLVAGAALGAAVVGVAWAIQRWHGGTELGAWLWLPFESWVFRLGSFAATGGAFWLVSGAGSSTSSTTSTVPARGFFGVVGVGALTAAAGLLERPWAAALLLVAGSAAVAVTLAGLSRPGRLFATALAGAAVSATAWGTAERTTLRATLRSGLEAVTAAARHETTTGELGEEVRSFLASADLSGLALGSPQRLEDQQDLALALWLASPLARHRALSALLVIPDDAPHSSFSYGLPVDEQIGELATDPRRWPVAEAAAEWAESALSGAVPLLDGDRQSGEVRYWYLPLREVPGHENESGFRADTTTLTRDLLGGTEDRLALMRLRSGIRVELGSASVWRGSAAPAVRVQLVDRHGFTGWSLPGQPFWVAGPAPLVPGSGLLVRLRAPALGPLQALRWAAVHSTAVLLAVLALLAVALLLALGREAPRRRLGRWLGSYSRKLAVVSIVLLALPLVLLNLLLLRAFEQRLEFEQRANGEDALRSAERILSDYLPTLEPGFSIETELDDALLSWLAQVVSHEVNLYWRGYVYASSKRELFTAGILPRRIPGEVFSELDPRAAATVARVNRVAPDRSYLELYRSIRLPGEGAAPGSARLFLSVPLLAQQEEVTETLAVFQQQALAVTATLLVILIAVASRLAASFTTPLTEIVERHRSYRRGRQVARPATERARAVGARGGDRRHGAPDRRCPRAPGAREAGGRQRGGQHHLGRGLDRARLARADVQPQGDGSPRMPRRRRPRRPGRSSAGGASPQPARATTCAPRAAHRTLRGRRGGDEREWTIVWVPVPGPGEPAALLVVEDVTEVLRGQRLEAWARDGAHHRSRDQEPADADPTLRRAPVARSGSRPRSASTRSSSAASRTSSTRWSELRAHRRGVLDLQPDTERGAGPGRPRRRGARRGGRLLPGAARRRVDPIGGFRERLVAALRPASGDASGAQPDRERHTCLASEPRADRGASVS